jgi:hypothetical protein
MKTPPHIAATATWATSEQPQSSPMNEIRTRIQVGPDHAISGTAPAEVPAGEHEVIIDVPPPDRKRFRLADLPLHDEKWDGGISMRGQVWRRRTLTRSMR